MSSSRVYHEGDREMAETKRPRRKRGGRNELGEERIGFEGFWNRRKTERRSVRGTVLG